MAIAADAGGYRDNALTASSWTKRHLLKHHATSILNIDPILPPNCPLSQQPNIF
jgi:hypothetical protein